MILTFVVVYWHMKMTAAVLYWQHDRQFWFYWQMILTSDFVYWRHDTDICFVCGRILTAAVVYWQQDTDSGKPKYCDRNPSLCHFALRYSERRLSSSDGSLKQRNVGGPNDMKIARENVGGGT